MLRKVKIPEIYEMFDAILLFIGDDKHFRNFRLDVRIGRETIKFRGHYTKIRVSEADSKSFKEFCLHTADRNRNFLKVFRRAATDGHGWMSETDYLSDTTHLYTAKTETTGKWTCIGIKLNFKLSEDAVALMKKRVVDVAAGCLSKPCGEKVDIMLNGKRIPFHSFHNYVELYTNADKDRMQRRSID